MKATVDVAKIFKNTLGDVVLRYTWCLKLEGSPKMSGGHNSMSYFLGCRLLALGTLKCDFHYIRVQ